MRSTRPDTDDPIVRCILVHTVSIIRLVAFVLFRPVRYCRIVRRVVFTILPIEHMSLEIDKLP